ncbi:MAG TPA: FGGY family carbohydrate kinase [Vicinamibacterales bacterium]
MPLYLGFDLSTQSLTAVVIDSDRRTVVFGTSLAFDRDLPDYGTRSGVLPSIDPHVVHAPPAMWADALERICAAVAARVEVSRIRAISGAAQQHGSVYMARDLRSALAVGDVMDPIGPRVRAALARATAPVWLDGSTSAQCRALAVALGGGRTLRAITGSRACERFTAAQIRKFAEDTPQAYARTARIHLVSSFMASLLIAGDAPVDAADASGMNLMDIATRRWSREAVDAAAAGLEARLPPIVESPTVIGPLAESWRRRFGFGAASVVAWTGDNPSTAVGLGLTRAGDLAVSLGTSDTVFGGCDADAIGASDDGHVFASAMGGYMALVCFANGSLARERIRDCCGLDWSGFAAALRKTGPNAGGAIVLPWLAAEITPIVRQAGLRTRGGARLDAATMIRGFVEGQAFAMRLHSRWFAPDVQRIRAAGGASANRDILQIIADVFEAEVLPGATTNAAALGAALRAWHGDRAAAGAPVSWDDLVTGFANTTADAVRPVASHAAVYRRLFEEYEAFERECLAADARASGCE